MRSFFIKLLDCGEMNVEYSRIYKRIIRLERSDSRQFMNKLDSERWRRVLENEATYEENEVSYKENEAKYEEYIFFSK